MDIVFHFPFSGFSCRRTIPPLINSIASSGMSVSIITIIYVVFWRSKFFNTVSFQMVQKRYSHFLTLHITHLPSSFYIGANIAYYISTNVL